MELLFITRTLTLRSMTSTKTYLCVWVIRYIIRLGEGERRSISYVEH